MFNSKAVQGNKVVTISIFNDRDNCLVSSQITDVVVVHVSHTEIHLYGGDWDIKLNPKTVTGMYINQVNNQ